MDGRALTPGTEEGVTLNLVSGKEAGTQWSFALGKKGSLDVQPV